LPSGLQIIRAVFGQNTDQAFRLSQVFSCLAFLPICSSLRGKAGAGFQPDSDKRFEEPENATHVTLRKQIL
jgi:hypothetical protein